jgi:hypothetical protein
MITIKPITWVRLALVWMGLGFSTLVTAAVQVDLAVNGSELVVTGNNAQCVGGPIDCIEVKQGTNPHMFFNLNGSCGNSGPAYKLTAFRIGLQNKVWPTSSNPLPENIAQDFSADPNTGYTDLHQGSNQLSGNKIKLKNHNSSAYLVYYEVTAAHCTDMTAPEIYLDPQIKNGGTN